jgi:general stress protein YciG
MINMSGTKAGGIKTRETNIKKYGNNYYAEIGRTGGLAKVPKGFALNRELARTAGAKGGTVSRRTSNVTGTA